MDRPNTILVYSDYKSPYAFLAKDLIYQLEDDFEVHLEWLPYTLDIPSYLGSARLDERGEVVESNRNAHQWRRVRYSYMDCRRQARKRGLVILGTRKIWDSSLAAIGMLWAKRHGKRQFRAYHDQVFERFWRRELDIEDPEAIAAVLSEVDADTTGFRNYLAGEGRIEHDAIRESAEAAGVFGVPSFIVEGELFWGREHLADIRKKLAPLARSNRLNDCGNKVEQDALVFDPRFIAMSPDPFPSLKAFRERDPVHWSTKLSAWILTSYSDVRKALKVPDMSANRLKPFFEHLPQGKRSTMADLIRYLSLWASFRDAPDHTRVRGILNAAFPLKIVEDWTPRIATIVDNLLDRMEQQSSPELIRDFGFRLPLTVIMDMLGVPASYLDDAGRWSNDIALFIGSSQNAPDKYERAQEATRRMKEMLLPIVANRRANPQKDLLSVLAHTDQGHGPLTDEEVLATCILLIVAGHETTALSIGNSVRTLLRYPEQLERLRDDLSLLPSAVEECLRFEGPVGSVGRVVAIDHEMRGKQLKKGDRVFLMIGAANRDNSAFKDPDIFDVGRTPNQHLTFGGGLHFCLGAPLARLEIKLALGEMIRRYPNMALTDQPLEWTNTLVMRGLKALPLRLK